MSNTGSIYTNQGQRWGNRRYTLEEYFDLDEKSEERLEFWGGVIVAMSGGSVNHALISANCSGELRGRLKGTPCRVFDPSLRVRFRQKTLYGHPDITIVCGDPAVDPDDKRGQSILNPIAAIEVLSPSTERDDRTKKFERYREIETFQEYVLVSQHEAHVEIYRRSGNGWLIVPIVVGLDGVARLESINVDLPLAEIYAGVAFPPPEPEIVDPAKT